MDHLSQTDDIFFARTALDRDSTIAKVESTLNGADDGDLFLESSHSESLLFDDGRLKSASYNQATGFWATCHHGRGRCFCPFWRALSGSS